MVRRGIDSQFLQKETKKAKEKSSEDWGVGADLGGGQWELGSGVCRGGDRCLHRSSQVWMSVIMSKRNIMIGG